MIDSPKLEFCRHQTNQTFDSVHSNRLILGYLKDSNAAAHSVDNDIFYVVIDLSARSKSYIITSISLSRVKLWRVT